MRKLMMHGNQACAYGAILAGCRFFAGYPITPSSEIAEEMALLLPQFGGRFIQMEDEISSMAAIIGASLNGIKSLTATSGPGFSLKQENLGYACQTEIPCVIVNVQRGGPSTGSPTMSSQEDMMQSKWGTHGDHPIIVLVPSSVQETLDLTITAFNFSEKFRVPVLIFTDEIIGHMTEKIILPDPNEIVIMNRKKPDCSFKDYLPYKETEDGIPPMANFGSGYRYHVTGLMHDESGFPTNSPELIKSQKDRWERKMKLANEEITLYDEINTEDIDTLIFSYGSTSRCAKRAIKIATEKGYKVGMLKAKTIWPFPYKKLEELSKNVKKIIVPEMNMGQMIGEVKKVVCKDIPIVGVNRYDGEPMHPSEIFNEIIKEK